MPGLRNKVAKLPREVRKEILEKLDDGWDLPGIAEWLLAQKAERDVPPLKLKAGDPYSLAWTRDQTTNWPVQRVCYNALARWRRNLVD